MSIFCIQLHCGLLFLLQKQATLVMVFLGCLQLLCRVLQQQLHSAILTFQKGEILLGDVKPELQLNDFHFQLGDGDVTLHVDTADCTQKYNQHPNKSRFPPRSQCLQDDLLKLCSVGVLLNLCGRVDWFFTGIFSSRTKRRKDTTQNCIQWGIIKNTMAQKYVLICLVFEMDSCLKIFYRTAIFWVDV